LLKKQVQCAFRPYRFLRSLADCLLYLWFPQNKADGLFRILPSVFLSPLLAPWPFPPPLPPLVLYPGACCMVILKGAQRVFILILRGTFPELQRSSISYVAFFFYTAELILRQFPGSLPLVPNLSTIKTPVSSQPLLRLARDLRLLCSFLPRESPNSSFSLRIGYSPFFAVQIFPLMPRVKKRTGFSLLFGPSFEDCADFSSQTLPLTFTQDPLFSFCSFFASCLDLFVFQAPRPLCFPPPFFLRLISLWILLCFLISPFFPLWAQFSPSQVTLTSFSPAIVL